MLPRHRFHSHPFRWSAGSAMWFFQRRSSLLRWRRRSFPPLSRQRHCHPHHLHHPHHHPHPPPNPQPPWRPAMLLPRADWTHIAYAYFYPLSCSACERVTHRYVGGSRSGGKSCCDAVTPVRQDIHHTGPCWRLLLDQREGRHPTVQVYFGSGSKAGRRLACETANPASLANLRFSVTVDVRAVCGKAARTND